MSEPDDVVAVRFVRPWGPYPIPLDKVEQYHLVRAAAMKVAQAYLEDKLGFKPDVWELNFGSALVMTDGQTMSQMGICLEPHGEHSTPAIRKRFKQIGGTIKKKGMVWLWFIPYSAIPGLVDDPEGY